MNDSRHGSAVGSVNVFDGLLNALRADPVSGPRFRAVEAMEAEIASAVECVDLDIAYTPVLMRAGDEMRNAVEVAYKAQDGRYVFDNPYKVVTADELKVMRARYLITRGKAMGPARERFR